MLTIYRERSERKRAQLVVPSAMHRRSAAPDP
jgi:hypothetical protein